MNKRIVIKILATILVLMLTFSNVILLGVYAVSEELENQQTAINRTKIEFDAYFKANGNKVHSIISDINTEDAKLYLSIKITEGKLDNAQAILSNSNFKFREYKDEQNIIQSIDLENSKIYFNSLSKGTDVTLEIPIEIKKEDMIDADYFTKESNIRLSGNYLNNLGEQIDVQKDIKVCMQLHGEEEVILEQVIDKYVAYNKDSMRGTLIQSTVKMGIANNMLPIKQASTTIEVPVINNVKPTTAIVVGKESTYNSQNGTLTINLNNEVVNEQISWPKNGPETYKIIYLYGEGAYTEQAVNIRQKVTTTLKAYNDEERIINQWMENNFTSVDKNKENISNTIQVNTQDLYKGFLYNNSQNETTYETTWKADIGYTNLESEISFIDSGDQYIYNTNEQETLVPNYAYYKTTYISKENFERILGVDGYINIYDAQGNLIGTINKDTQLDENNNYVFNYNRTINAITIITSKPNDNIMGEELVISHNKAIRADGTYTLNQLKLFNGIRTAVNGKESRIRLNEISTTAELSIDKTSVSTATNNSVQFTATLRTESPMYELYSNPVIDIKLPNYVENIEITNVDVLYANNELSIAGTNKFEDGEGNKILRITLNGTQSDYLLNSASKGASIFINANIQTRKFMASEEANIEMICRNGKDNTVSNSSVKMNFVSESGIIMANSLSNYNGNSQITSLKGETKLGTLEMNASSKIATVSMSLINNEKTDINGAVILGRLPFAGNKTVATGKELGSNLTAQLQALIASNGINADIYYSDNEEASYDIQNTGNRWTKDATTNTKSYLIVFNETFKKGQTVNFAYNITIPENLGTDKIAYSNYAVYYNNQGYDSPIVGMATELVMVEEHRDQIEDGDGNITDLNPGNVVKGQDLVTATMEYYLEESHDSLVGVNDILNYILTIKNNTSNEIENINVIDALGGNVEFIKASISSDDQEENASYNTPIYNSSNHNVTWKIIKLPANQTIKLRIQVKAKNYKASGINNSCIVSNNDIYLVEQNTIQMKSPAVVTATMSGSVLDENVKENTKITYTILANNTGGDIATVNVASDLPEGMKIINALYYLDSFENNINILNANELNLNSITILPGRALKVVFEAEVEELPEDISQRELETFAIISGTDINVKTNSVKYIVKKDTDPDNPSSLKKAISGFVWNDENKNGKKDSSESGIADVTVKLFNSTGSTAGQVKTDNEGKYKIDELESGKYIVMFEYDSKLYGVTSYKKDDVIETLNSDAKETTYEGKKVAMTDTIEITDSSKTNINLGLIRNNIFDLKLDKYIDSITVQNDQGTSTYDYTDTNFAKVELVSRYIPSTTVLLKYRIAVKNEGDIPGYVKQIVDYLPQDLKFSSELNKEWYVNTDGNLYSASLANDVINPGETKNIELIVTKKMNENNTGLITNQAEIAESYNEQGVEDYDSTQANKNQNEDDISVANVIIGVKTGGAALYIIITLVCIAIIAAGVYVINKKVLRGIK